MTDDVVQARSNIFVPAAREDGPAQQRVAEVLAHMRGVAERMTTAWWFSHASAALVWGCWTWRLAPEVHVTQLSNPSVRKADDPLLVRHWTRLLPPRDRAQIAGVPVTSLERTVIDCARLLREPQALVIADSALRLGANRSTMATILSESAGRRGVRRARLVMELADGRSESPGETLVRWIAHSYGLPAPEPAVHISARDRDYLVDLAWPELKLGIEFDGAVKYSGGVYGDPAERAAARDRRQANLEAAGWTILTVTWEDLAEPHVLARRLNAALHEAELRLRRL